jgi:hypothetical protein
MEQIRMAMLSHQIICKTDTAEVGKPNSVPLLFALLVHLLALACSKGSITNPFE